MRKKIFLTFLLPFLSTFILTSCQSNIPQQVKQGNQQNIAQTESENKSQTKKENKNSLGAEVLGDIDKIAKGNLEGITIKIKDGRFITASVEDMNPIKIKFEVEAYDQTLREVIDNQQQATIDYEDGVIKGVNNLYANNKYEWVLYVNGDEKKQSIDEVKVQINDTIYLVYQKK